MMTATEILEEISKLPLAERKKLKQSLMKDTDFDESINSKLAQNEFDRLLYDEGLLVDFPVEPTDEDDFEPIKFEGKPISETIIEERR